LSKKARRPLNRINLAAWLRRRGLPIGDAARRANVSEEQVQRALGVAKKQLLEGEHMTEHGRKLGAAGLSYSTPAAEEMIAERMRRLGEARHVAVGQLAASGDLKTMGEVTRQSVSLAEARRGEVSAEERRAQTLYERAKAEAAERGVSLSRVMNERALNGEVQV
jgi:predicted flavoprotein YhiN